MRFKKKLTNNILNPMNASNLGTSIGEVINYYPEHNCADIFVTMLGDAEGSTIEKVPIQITSQGIRMPSLKNGDVVYVAFNNNSIFQPKIIGFADENYMMNTWEKQKHIKQGYLVPSSSPEEGTVKVPSCDTWLSEDKELFTSTTYMNLSPVSDSLKSLEELGHFKENEVALINPNSTSIIKVRDDGTIEVFAKDNTGIKVNSVTKTIEILGDFSTKSKNWSVLSNNINIISNDTLTVTTKKLNVTVDEFTLNGRRIDGKRL